MTKPSNSPYTRDKNRKSIYDIRKCDWHRIHQLAVVPNNDHNVSHYPSREYMGMCDQVIGPANYPESSSVSNQRKSGGTSQLLVGDDKKKLNTPQRNMRRDIANFHRFNFKKLRPQKFCFTAYSKNEININNSLIPTTEQDFQFPKCWIFLLHTQQSILLAVGCIPVSQGGCVEQEKRSRIAINPRDVTPDCGQVHQLNLEMSSIRV